MMRKIDFKKVNKVESNAEDFFNQTSTSSTTKERVRIHVDLKPEDLRRLDKAVADRQQSTLKAVKRTTLVREVLLEWLNGSMV